MKLSQLKVGQSAKVLEINTSIKIKQRLERIGLIKGITVAVVRKAPFSGPIEIKLRDFYLAIRKFDASKITVEI